MKYGTLRKDANQSKIIKILKLYGAKVIDMSDLGSGIPDLLIIISDKIYFADVKNNDNQYGKKGLSNKQKDWARKNNIKVYIIYDVDDAIALLNGELNKLKYYGD